MTWTIKLHEKRPEHPQVGDMFPAPWLLDHWREHLSESYFAERSHRPPLLVRLPGGYDFCIDFRDWVNGEPRGSGWAVTGEAPRVTLSPSVNIGGMYHGWIRDGVISDDCEGRRFA